MEMIQTFAAFFVAFAIAGAVMQVLFAYSLQVIAEKNELPDFAQFISWIPVLQIYPLVKVGGGNFKKFLLVGIGGTIGMAIGAGVAAAALGEMGAIVSGVLVGGFVIFAIVYFVRLAMRTAELRGLPGWIGLLNLIPIVNVVVYPYIAFHDGFRAPNKLGAVLGLVLFIGPVPGQIAAVNQLTAQAGEMAQTDLGNGVTMEQAMSGLGVAMELGMQLSMLEEMDPSNPAQARMMRDQIAEIRSKLDENARALGPDAVAQMEASLAGVEQRLANPGAPSPDLAMGQEMEDDMPPAYDDSFEEPADTYQPPTLSARPPLTDGLVRSGNEGFPIPAAPDCPPGTQRQGAAPPDGGRHWCEKTGSDAGIKHGWMTEYWDNGNPKVAGEYRDGLRVGVWSRFYEDGAKRVQAEFTDGLQDGVLLSWNPDGTLAYEKQFSQGAPASR